MCGTAVETCKVDYGFQDGPNCGHVRSGPSRGEMHRAACFNFQPISVSQVPVLVFKGLDHEGMAPGFEPSESFRGILGVRQACSRVVAAEVDDAGIDWRTFLIDPFYRHISVLRWLLSFPSPWLCFDH